MPTSAGFETGFFAVEVETASPVRDADDFARAVILTICQASVAPRVGRQAYERCMRALSSGSTARLGLRHPGKADAIDRVWQDRARYYRAYLDCSDKAAFLCDLPWIGPVTRRSLEWRLGLGKVGEGQSHRAAA